MGKTGYASMPGGPAGRVGTLGGSGLAVSRYSAHPQEAIEFVRFLIRTQIQSSVEESTSSKLPAQPEVYDLGSALNSSEKSGRHRNGVVNRPSGVVGSAYEQVTRAYYGAVHSVLTGQRGAPEAAAELEKQLVKITGFNTGPPKTWD
jgi:trehalose/maltose transport system substrate-binding protein